MNKKILVVDDDQAGCRLLQALLTPEGFDVTSVGDGRSGLAQVESNTPDLVILDLHLPDINGIEVLEKIKIMKPFLPVVMVTVHAEIQPAIRAIRLGAFEYLSKPLNSEEIIVVIRRALEKSALLVEVKELRQQLEEGGLIQQMGSSAQIQRIVEQVKVVSSSDLSVLILGETGTGKELVAQAIHRQSSRKTKPFIALDCGAIPDMLLESELFGHEKGAFTGAHRRKEGQFHLAEGGTLFLDEVGNLPLALQAKLLRVMESKQIQSIGAARSTAMDVRFVEATNIDLQERIAQGKFRSDFYFRLAQYTIVLPPLRERPEDIPHLSQKFLEEARLELRRPVTEIQPEVLDLFQKYPWPGNVRELRNVIRQAVLEATNFTLPFDLIKTFLNNKSRVVTKTSTLGKSLKEVADKAAKDAERDLISETLLATHGNKSQAARILKTDYKTLHTKIKNFGM